MHNSDPNLHLLGEGTPIDWGEEYGGQSDSDTTDEKQRRAKQVVSVIHVDEGALPYEVTSLEGSQDGSQLEPEESNPSPSPPPQSSPDSVKELRGMLVKEFHVDVPTAVGEKVEEPLSNGTVVQDGKGIPEATEEEKVPEACPATDTPTVEHFPKSQDKEKEVPAPAPASPTKAPSLAADRRAPADCPEPSNKETGEETSSQVCAAKEDPSAMDDSEGLQTQF